MIILAVLGAVAAVIAAGAAAVGSVTIPDLDD